MADALLHDGYEVLGRVGEGGAGVVYRVRERGTGAVVAMKVMPRAAGARNLRGEFLALRRLRHRNIVAVHDVGLTRAGDDFFTMDYVGGPSLRGATRGGFSELFFQLAGGSLEALAFIHSRGVVHADIKPSNILVDATALAERPHEAARLVDFGLSAALTDPAASAARGTFPYAAPEVYAGALDARSDLYAFGVVLYELATESQPFFGDDIAAAIAAQRTRAPADPRALNSGIPDALAELIVALLEPSPGARPQTADEVLARINEIGGTGFSESGAAPLVSFGSAFVGRDADRERLESVWEQARQGRGGSAVVRGEEGIGKSRLLAELKLAIQLRGGDVHTADAAATRAPFSGLGRLVRSVLAGAGDLGANWKQVLAPILGDEARPSEIDREVRFALAEAITSIALEAAATSPLAILVDNADAADAGTCEILAYLCRASAGSPLFVAIGVRDGMPAPGADDEATPLASLVAAVEASDHGRVLALAPLDRSSIYRLAEATLGAAVASDVAPELHRASGGNPGHAASALEALVERGALRRHRGRWRIAEDSLAIPAPAGARDAARDRARSLSGDAQHVLEAAAAAGDAFARDEVVAAVAPEFGARARDVVDEALAEASARRLVHADAAAGRFEFLHRELAASLYGGVPAARRKRYHARAAEWLSRAAQRGEPVSPSSLADHYTALGDSDRAAHWGRLAGEERAGAYDYHGAIAAFRRVVRALAGDAEAAAPARERLAELLATVGDAEGARVDFRLAADARPRGDHARLLALRRLADVERQLGAGDDAQAHLMRALDEARAAGLSEDEALAHHALGRVLMYRSDYKQALEHATAGEIISQTAGLRGASAAIGGLRADIELYRGDTRAALAHLDAGMRDAEATGDEALIGRMLLHLGRAAVHAGDYRRAADALERAIPVNQRAGRVHIAARAMNNLGAAHYLRGDWERARSRWEQFRDLCTRLDERAELATALNNLGILYRDQGAMDEAEEAFDRGERTAAATDYAYMRAMIVGNRGEVLFRKGEIGEARACYEEALAEFERIGAREEIAENNRRLCEVDLASGHPAHALDRAIDAAREAKDAGARLEEGILHRIAAHALRVRGDLESATWFCERAREIVAMLDARYERARLDVEAAELALARGGADEAQALIGSAIDSFAELGARWDLSRARVRQREIAPRQSPRDGAGLDLLLELGRATAHHQLDALLRRTLDRVLERSDFERGFILLLGEDGGPRERMRRTRSGSRSFAPDDAAFSGSVVKRVASSGEAVSFTDIDHEDDLRHQRSVVALGLRRVMCAPMRAHGRVLGVLYIDSTRLAVGEAQLELPVLEAFAAQLALAVDNARLRDEERRKTELVAILAHEIRNPLGGILGYASMGADGEPDPDESAGMFARIHRDAQRLSRIVDNVMELTRHESGNVDWSMAAFDLGELVCDVAESYRPQCESRGIDLEIAATGVDRRPLGNADRIGQVVSNLLSNAVKFTPEGGRVRVRAYVESLADRESESGAGPSPELRAWAPLDSIDDGAPDCVRVDVQDSGPGMEEELRARLFEKFVQGGERRRAGIGLGLYISREIVERHGGQIWASSELGAGSTFSFRIPANA